MSTFRVPYPSDSAQRQAIFEKAVTQFGSYGSFEGTHDAGTFEAKTPIGSFVGSYFSAPGSSEVEFHIRKKPFLIPLSLIHYEARKFVETA